MKSEYFIVLIVTIIVPLIMSFSRKINFYSDLKKFIFSLIVPFLLFVAIDMISTRRNLWTFNPDFISGIYIINLPLEEVLFFIVIPFSCLFLWETVKYLERRFKKND